MTGLSPMLIPTCLCTALAAVPSANAQSETPKPDAEAPPSCVIQIVSDPLEPHAAERLLYEFIDPVYRQHSEDREVPVPFWETLAVEYLPQKEVLPGRTHSRILIARVNWPEFGIVPPRAGFWPALCERVSAVLNEANTSAYEEAAGRLAQAEAELATTRERFAQLQEQRRTFWEETGMVEPSHQEIADEFAELREEVRDRETEMRLLRARQEAIEKQIATISERMESNTESIEQELHTIINAKEQHLDRLRELIKHGQAGNEELLQAEAELAEARIEALHHRRELREQAGGEQLDELTNALTETSVELEEHEVVLETLRARLEKMENADLMQRLDHYQREVMLELPYVEHRARDLRKQVQHLRDTLKHRREPTVKILGHD